MFNYCHSRSLNILVINQRRRPMTPLPVLGGTKPKPLAPTITPLVSELTGAGPTGNNTGPVMRK